MFRNIFNFYQFCTVGLLVTNIGPVISSKGCEKINLIQDLNSWNVGIYMKEKTNTLDLLCLGTVIKPNTVVTAAHCLCDGFSENLRPNTTFYIKLGDLPKKLTTSEHGNLFEIMQKNIFINDHYKGLLNHLSDDIVVIKIQDAQFLNIVKPICIDWAYNLPEFQNKQTGNQVIWIDKNAHLSEISLEKYENCLVDAPENLKTFVNDRTFCGITQDNFSNIGGAGLIISHDNVPYLRGVSSSIDVHNKHTTIYTDLNLHINWLSNIYASD